MVEVDLGRLRRARNCAVGISEKATRRESAVPLSRVKGGDVSMTTADAFVEGIGEELWFV